MQLDLSKEKLIKIFNALRKDGLMIFLSSPSELEKLPLKMLSKKITTIFQFLTLLDNQDQMKIKTKITFVNEADFKRLIKNEEFLEYAKVFNNFYGTTRTPVIDKLNKGRNVLFDIDWQGADQIKK